MQAIGQLLIAATIIGLIPVDAAQLEWYAGVGNEADQLVPASDVQHLYASLPAAEQADRMEYPVKVDVGSHGIVTTAQSALVMDKKSGMMLLAEHPDEVRSIGSVTKLMSALVFLDTNPDLSDMVELDANLDLVYGGRIYLKFADGIKLGDVLSASLIGSDNSATQSLVRFSGMTEEEFVKEMNRKAESLGMTSSKFADPTGILPENVSTARDLVKLLIAAEHRPEIKRNMMTKSISITQQSGFVASIENTNLLLGSYLNEEEYSIQAGKTGYLPQAGYVLVTTVKEGDHSVHVIVLGAATPEARVQEAKGLAAWAFKAFKWPTE